MRTAWLVLALTWGTSLVSASCPITSAVETLDLKQLEGKWYQLLSFGTFIVHGLGRCQEITANTDGKGFTMDTNRISRLMNANVKYTWNVETKGDKPSGDLIIKSSLPIFRSLMSMPLKVLGTDYKNYVVFYVCREFFYFFRYSAGFVLIRKRHYDAKELESMYASIDETLKKNCLSRSQFTLSDQTNCEAESSPSKAATSTDVSQVQASPQANPVEEKKPSEISSASGTAATTV